MVKLVCVLLVGCANAAPTGLSSDDMISLDVGTMDASCEEHEFKMPDGSCKTSCGDDMEVWGHSLSFI